MTIIKRRFSDFSCPILSLLNLVSTEPFNLKHSILYLLPNQSCWRSGAGQIICALFATRNQKLLNISFGTVLIRIHSVWKCFESYYFVLRKQLVHLTLKKYWIGILTSECPLLNYLKLIWKIYLWSCRRNEVLPNIDSFLVRVNSKYEIEKYICTKNKSLQ